MRRPAPHAGRTWPTPASPTPTCLRLGEAATALTAPGSHLTVSEAAARRHFTDSSHFIRAFKKQYRATPAQFARRPT
ncbi:helix-turn-helix domain-containing protein [Streptomyces sp. NPDC046870]|uniref:helix-turn-helix domain-containing protein n=1 Tax=Streptomyces sp. NPDC046870 TaxID=3155135 RepID=UPI003453459F